jgi:hypothetical protein
MLLLDTSFLIEFEGELAHRKIGPARGVLAAHRRETVAISIIAFGKFAEGFADPRACHRLAYRGAAELALSATWGK